MRRCPALLAAALLSAILAACGVTPPRPTPAPPPTPAPAPAPREETPQISNSTQKYLARRNLKPQPTRPLNVASRCSHDDKVDTRIQLDLRVENAVVKTFAAQVAMKDHGVCRFDLKDFEQTATLPQPLLRHQRAGDCTVRMWEQESKVTIAFSSCQIACEGKAFDYLWPVVVDTRGGGCY